REQLDLEKNLIDNVCGGQEFIDIDGKRRHAISYLGDFLFSPDRVRTPAKALSGGEQNRAILAKVFSKPANILVLDEPTNDLDIETLELLEEILMNFKGTVLLVSHDRKFMDNVITSLMVFEGNGEINEYVGGYGDWVSKGGNLADLPSEEVATAVKQDNGMQGAEKTASKAAIKTVTAKPKKLSYKDQRELEALPEKIEELEVTQTELEQEISKPEFYQGDSKLREQTIKQMSDIQSQLEKHYQRWDELEALKS
ncbi:MAG: ABC transporter ATP-binding protein, partial [SAR86 cluster bacterium]